METKNGLARDWKCCALDSGVHKSLKVHFRNGTHWRLVSCLKTNQLVWIFMSAPCWYKFVGTQQQPALPPPPQMVGVAIPANRPSSQLSSSGLSGHGGGESAGGDSVGPNQSGSRERRRSHRRVTRHESRYHSEVRQEAVQQVLAAMQNRPKPSLPMPSKRTSVMAKSPDREHHAPVDSDSSSDDDSASANNEGGGSSLVSTPERDRAMRYVTSSLTRSLPTRPNSCRPVLTRFVSTDKQWFVLVVIWLCLGPIAARDQATRVTVSCTTTNITNSSCNNRRNSNRNRIRAARDPPAILLLLKDRCRLYLSRLLHRSCHPVKIVTRLLSERPASPMETRRLRVPSPRGWEGVHHRPPTWTMTGTRTANHVEGRSARISLISPTSWPT